MEAKTSKLRVKNKRSVNKSNPGIASIEPTIHDNGRRRISPKGNKGPQSSNVSMVPSDPTISSFGGPDSEIVLDDGKRDSGYWILKPEIDVVANAGKIQSNPKLTDVSEVIKVPKKQRPAAPKPVVKHRSLIRESMSDDRKRRASSVSFVVPSEIGLMAISSTADLRWQSPEPQHIQMREKLRKPTIKVSLAVGEEDHVQHSHPLKPSDSLEREVSMMTESKEKTPEVVEYPEEREMYSYGMIDATKYEAGEPSVAEIASCSKGPAPIYVTDQQAIPPVTKYCPWHARPIYDTWVPRPNTFPPWLSPEERGRITKTMESAGKNICVQHEEAKETPICCFSERDTKHAVEEKKKVPKEKPIRPEVRRWLVGFPQNKRFEREIQDLKRNPPSDLTIICDESNERHIFIDMLGPVGSLYDGGLFQIEIFFPADYPKNPPMMRFMTKIYHPEIDKLGRINLSIIREKWSPSVLFREVMEALRASLVDPKASDEPFAPDVAMRWFSEESVAQKTARLWTKKYAHRHSAARWLDCQCDCCCEQLAAVFFYT